MNVDDGRACQADKLGKIILLGLCNLCGVNVEFRRRHPAYARRSAAFSLEIGNYLLPFSPCARCAEPRLVVGRIELCMVRRDDVLALGLRDRCNKFLPALYVK